MHRRFHPIVAVLFFLGALAASAADTVDGSFAVPYLDPPIPETRLTHGFAAFDRGGAEAGNYKLYVVLAEQPLADKIKDPANNPVIALERWRMQSQKVLGHAELVIDERATPSLTLGRKNQGNLGVDGDNVQLRLTRIDGQRVVGEFVVAQPGTASAKVKFDLPILATQGLDPAVTGLLAGYPKLRAAAEDGARKAYAALLGSFDGKPAEGFELAWRLREAIDQGQPPPLPATVYGARIDLDPHYTNRFDSGQATAKFATCEKSEDGGTESAIVELKRDEPDGVWTIEGAEHDEDKLARFGPVPAACR